MSKQPNENDFSEDFFTEPSSSMKLDLSYLILRQMERMNIMLSQNDYRASSALISLEIMAEYIKDDEYTKDLKYIDDLLNKRIEKTKTHYADYFDSLMESEKHFKQQSMPIRTIMRYKAVMRLFARKNFLPEMQMSVVI